MVPAHAERKAMGGAALNDHPRYLPGNPPLEFQTSKELMETCQKLMPSFRAYQFLRDAIEDLATSRDLPAVKQRRAEAYHRYINKAFSGLEDVSESGL
jgi:hypothetical protein